MSASLKPGKKSWKMTCIKPRKIIQKWVDIRLSASCLSLVQCSTLKMAQIIEYFRKDQFLFQMKLFKVVVFNSKKTLMSNKNNEKYRRICWETWKNPEFCQSVKVGISVNGGIKAFFHVPFVGYVHRKEFNKLIF